MNSPIIIALDPPSYEEEIYSWVEKIFLETIDIVAGYKIGLPLIIRTERRELAKISELLSEAELNIVDLKLADIGEIMVETVNYFIEHGYRYYIAHAFIGYSDGLLRLSQFLSKNNAKLITIISMSHTGSREIMDGNLDKLIETSIKSNAWGVVIGATKPELIRYTRSRFEERNIDVKILSPGIGFQGTPPSTALRAGADYEIIGRTITRSDKPGKKLMELIDNYYREWMEK